MRSSSLKDTIQPRLKASILFSLLTIVVSLVLAVGLSNLALNPLVISRRVPGN